MGNEQERGGCVGKVRGSKRVWEGVVVGWSMAVVW